MSIIESKYILFEYTNVSAKNALKTLTNKVLLLGDCLEGLGNG